MLAIGAYHLCFPKGSPQHDHWINLFDSFIDVMNGITRIAYTCQISRSIWWISSFAHLVLRVRNFLWFFFPAACLFLLSCRAFRRSVCVFMLSDANSHLFPQRTPIFICALPTSNAACMVCGIRIRILPRLVTRLPAGPSPSIALMNAVSSTCNRVSIIGPRKEANRTSCGKA